MFIILGFYKFKNLKSLKRQKKNLENLFSENDIRGTLIISKEGLNGTLSGKSKNIYKISKIIKNSFKIKNFDSENLSKSKLQPFHKPKIKIKKEVVPMGIKINPNDKKNNHLEPSEWNNLIKNKNTLVLDARKPFEYEIGSFKSAVNPKVKNFREFPKYLSKLGKNKTVAMFCTGGIRCEKASIYLKQRGFKNVFQLKGGILNYLKKIKKDESKWNGECFVFDNRVSLKHNLQEGSYIVCSGCRIPISNKQKRSKKYEEGVSCPRCYDTLTKSQVNRFRMRQKQILLAKKAGKKHKFQKEY
ncbi:rhodanese-related sulfurtransferase [Pelagibacterales bacterium SAG-MED28]|nr:rhodanese-related sulfurtransferase [Pelagibacterales bacterium SAG-MED28]